MMNNNRGCAEKYPSMDMDEQCNSTQFPTQYRHFELIKSIPSLDEIKIDTRDEPNSARIIAFSAWGILRGMESFSQLVYTDPDRGGMVSGALETN